MFQELDRHLKEIAKVVRELDPNARVYLAGSVAEERYMLSSDVDVLVVTKLKPAFVMGELWKRGVKDPFEIHVVSREELKLYAARGKLVEIH